MIAREAGAAAGPSQWACARWRRKERRNEKWPGGKEAPGEEVVGTCLENASVRLAADARSTARCSSGRVAKRSRSPYLSRHGGLCAASEHTCAPRTKAARQLSPRRCPFHRPQAADLPVRTDRAATDDDGQPGRGGRRHHRSRCWPRRQIAAQRVSGQLSRRSTGTELTQLVIDTSKTRRPLGRQRSGLRHRRRRHRHRRSSTVHRRFGLRLSSHGLSGPERFVAADHRSFGVRRRRHADLLDRRRTGHGDRSGDQRRQPQRRGDRQRLCRAHRLRPRSSPRAMPAPKRR